MELGEFASLLAVAEGRTIPIRASLSLVFSTYIMSFSHINQRTPTKYCTSFDKGSLVERLVFVGSSVLVLTFAGDLSSFGAYRICKFNK